MAMDSQTDGILSRRSFIGGVLGAAASGASNAPVAETAGAAVSHGPLGKVVGTLPPGRYDMHIHVANHGKFGEPNPDELWREMREAGLSGGCLFSASCNRLAGNRPPIIPKPEDAMDNCIAWASGSPTIYPFYYIDPGAPDALELVDMAVEKGFYGFKVIRSSARPCDERTIPVYAKIAASGKPLVFHSGILWDALPSSEYFRPVLFEGLLEVPGLRFALAHVSWPWHDECLAVFGKLYNAPARRGTAVPKMFIDTTRGTPEIYRKEVLTKIAAFSWHRGRIMFGTDCVVSHYNVKNCRHAMGCDDAIFGELGLDAQATDRYYRGALQDFLFG